jgi:hypothetical protein
MTTVHPSVLLASYTPYSASSTSAANSYPHHRKGRDDIGQVPEQVHRCVALQEADGPRGSRLHPVASPAPTAPPPTSSSLLSFKTSLPTSCSTSTTLRAILPSSFFFHSFFLAEVHTILSVYPVQVARFFNPKPRPEPGETVDRSEHLLS